jgi:hypothetical protein
MYTLEGRYKNALDVLVGKFPGKKLFGRLKK